MISRRTIDDVLASAQVDEVLSDFMTLKRKGANYEGLCPFHNEKTPSFKVNPAKGIYKCFGCGKAGGNFVWAKQLGGTSSDIISSLTVDALGNVYTIGAFQGTADFDPHPTNTFNLTSTGGYDVFISKLDADGNFVWAKQLGGTGGDIGSSLTVDALGNVYTIGYFRGTVDFDPHPTDTFNLTSAGISDVFISKLDADGNFLWAKQLGGTGSGIGRSLTVDALGNVYTAGYFNGTADFDPHPTDTFNLTSAGGMDIFISKLDADGNFVWAKQLGGISDDYVTSLIVDASGNVYTTGYFNGTADFDPHPTNTFNLTSAGGSDVFISKLDAGGNFVWAKRLGGTSVDYGYSLTVDASGNVYTTGAFIGTADFNPHPADTFNLTSAGATDVFISKLDIDGTFLWAKRLGGTGSDVGFSLTVDASDNVYTTGRFDGTANFDPNPADTFNLTSAGSYDIFVLKLKCIPTTATDSKVACDSFTWINGKTYFTSNDTATFVIPNKAGCDSIITLHLTINPLPATPAITQNGHVLSTDSFTSYQWYLEGTAITGATNRSHTATEDGTYTVSVTDENDCENLSAEYTFSTVGINSPSPLSPLSLYPNPINSTLTIQTEETGNAFVITDIHGRVVKEGILQATKTDVDLSEVVSGLYFVRVGNKVAKIVRE